MTITVNVHEAKTRLSQLLTQVQAGEEVIIAKAGRPQAKLVPIRDETERRPGIVKGAVTDAFFEPLPEEELRAWERS